MTHRRKASLCNATATLDQVMTHMAEEYPSYKNYVCLAPTSPLRTSKHVEEALTLHIKRGCDSLVSVKEEYKSIWEIKPNGFAKPLVERFRNRQEVEPIYIANGAIFITTKETLLQHKRRLAGHVGLYIMDEKSSLDVHNEYDIKLGEHYLNG